MQASLRILARTFVAATVLLGAAACADASNPVSPPARSHHLAANSTVTLSTGTTLGVGSSVTYGESMPSSGTIYLRFDGRINYASTIGNSNILDIEVNGTPVTISPTKGSTYTYGNQGRSENYFDNRGRSTGPSLWGLFWSPDFSSNASSSDYYYVSSGSPYTYEYNISSYINYGQTNTITLKNDSGWLQTITGLTPNVVFQNIQLQAV
jgi:hypothetical protein